MKLLSLGLQQPEKRDNGGQLTPPLPIAQIARWGDLFGGAGSDSGETVNSQTAMQTATVNSCVRLLSESIASMSPILYEKVGNGRQEALNNPLHDLLCLQPNEDSSAFTLWDSFVASIALTGNGYLELTRNPQRDVTALWFLHPATVQPIRQADGSIAYRTTEGLAPGNFKLLKAADVIHVPWHSLNGVTGISPIEQARNAIGGAIAMDKFGGRFFANNATPSGIISMLGKVKPEDKPKMRADWEMQQVGSNQRRINILDQGTTFTPITISQSDSQFLESKNYTRQEICGLFRVHPSQIGDTSRVAGETYAAQQLTFLNDCLRPWLNRIQQELTRKLLPKNTGANIPLHMMSLTDSRWI